MNIKTEKLTPRDFISIGIYGAISLVIFFVVGGIAGLTIVGTVANIPITSFFTSIAYMLLVLKVRKKGTFLIMGIINVLPGLMAAIGWAAAEVIASANHYQSKKILVLTYVVGCTLQSALFTLPMYLSNAQYLTERQEILHLTDAALQQYLSMFTWPVYAGMVLLTAVLSLLGAVISIRILKKHFVKAGLI